MNQLQNIALLFLLALNPTFANTTKQQPKGKPTQEISKRNEDPKINTGYSTGAEYYGNDVNGYSAGPEYPPSDMGGNYDDGYRNSYSGNFHSNGYGGDTGGVTGEYGNGNGGGYSGTGDISHSVSYSSDSYGDSHLSGLSNDGWNKHPKTVVKHVVKNIAVPHPVPAPVQVPVPKYIKYFKPFAIAKPVAVPHVIPVIKHIQKPIPFFASLPIQQTVPVPRFVSLPVQVRVPRPVFIHVPKIVPVAKKYPVPVEVNIPKPFIVPVYKSVPIPIPHKVPKVINIIKEVPHYVKKPVPVYLDSHSNEYGGDHRYAGNNYDNYGNNFGGNGGYGHSAEGSYGGMNPGPSHYDMPYGNGGYGGSGSSDYGIHNSYGNTQDSMKYNSPYLYDHSSQQAYNQQNNFHRKPNFPPISFPRAYRLPNKSQPTQNGGASNYYSINQGSNVSSQNGNAGSTYNSQAAYETGSYDTPSASQQKALNQLGNFGTSYNNNNAGYGTGGSYSVPLNGQSNPVSGNHLNTQGSNTGPVSAQVSSPTNTNSATKFSQPVFQPSAYAEYVLSQQQSNQQTNYVKNVSTQYSPNYATDNSPQSTATPSSGMATQASKSHPNYMQYPSHGFNNAFSVSQQSNAFNSIPQQHLSDYNMIKSLYPNLKLNNEYEQAFKQASAFQSASSWNPGNGYSTQTTDYNHQNIPQYHNEVPSYHQPQMSSGYNKENGDFYNKPSGNNFNSVQTGQKTSFYEGNNQNNYNQNNYNQNNYNQNNVDSYIPSGSSFSSNTYSNSYTPPSPFQNSDIQNFSPYTPDFKDKNFRNMQKHNEKFDQSSSQNIYASDSNIAGQNSYSPSGSSISYSSYGNNFAGSQSFTPYENKNSFNINSDIPDFSSPTANKPFNTGSDSTSSHDFSHLVSDYNQKQNSDATVPRQSSNSDSLNNQNSFANFVSTDSPKVYNQQSDNYPSSYSSSSSYNSLPQSNFQFQSLSNSKLQSYTENESLPSTVNSFNDPVTSSPDTATSFSYSFSHKGSHSQPVYSGTFYGSPQLGNGELKGYSQKVEHYSTQNPFSDFLNLQPSNKPSTQEKGDSQAESSQAPLIFQGYDTKLDEMEQHMQSSAASSIINVYTNSPNSKEAQKGQTFSFIDTGALDSSPSMYYQPPDSDSGTKNGYSNIDLQIVQAPSFNSEPNEPLQTSLDAYSPPQPVYRPPNNQNTVYKAALSVTDPLYKEAISLDSDSKAKSS